VAQSDSKAAQYTTKAAEGGLKEAMPLLAEHYFEGKGVPTSVSKAAKWVRLAIEKGGEPKLYLVHNIAFAYSEGQGVKKSLSSSLDLYEYAAQKGNSNRS
jgi:localization factor PodJL